MGKKTIGMLDVLQNGFRFQSNKGVKVEFAFANVKHAFYQPCDDEVIVLIHFKLKAPIQINQKNVSDITFYQEIANQFDDLDQVKRNRGRRTDFDELEQEKRERAHKKRLNERFLRFSEQITEFTKNHDPSERILVDRLESDFKFYGSHHKASTFIYPTQHNCLVSLTEIPPMVIDLTSVQLAHLERVAPHLHIKNFDLVLVSKDFLNFKRLSSIPTESLMGIRQSLTDRGIMITSGPMPLNWVQVLQSIRDDFHQFVNDGGWTFLYDQSEDPAEMTEKGSDASGSEFEDASGSEPEGSDEDDDYSGSDEDADSAESSSVQASELSDEGMTMEEVEREEKSKQAAAFKAAREEKSRGAVHVRLHR